jgi:Ca2+/Na+ antiporter
MLLGTMTGVAVVYTLKGGMMELAVAAFVLLLLIVGVFFYMKQFNKKRQVMETALKIKGPFRSEIRGSGKTSKIYYYIGDYPVFHPAHWEKLNYLQEGRVYQCEGIPIGLFGPEEKRVHFKQGFLLVTADNKYSIDRERKNNLKPVDSESSQVAAFLFAIALFVFTPIYLVNDHHPLKLFRYLTIARQNQSDFDRPAAFVNTKPVQWQAVALNHVLLLNEKHGSSYVHENEALFWEAFHKLRTKTAAREKEVQQLKRYKPAKDKGNKFWNSFELINHGTSFQDLQKKYQSTKLARQVEETEVIWGVGPQREQSLYWGFFEDESAFAALLREENDRLNAGIRKLTEEIPPNSRIRLKRIYLHSYPASNWPTVLAGKMVWHLDELKVFLEREYADQSITGIVTSVDYNSREELVKVTIDCGDTYDLLALFGSAAVFIMIMGSLVLSIVVIIRNMGFNRKVHNEIDRHYRMFSVGTLSLSG